MLEAKRKRESEFITRNITLNMSLPKLKEKMYLSIIDRSFKTQSNEAFLPLIGADGAASHFAVGLLRMLNLEQVRKERFHGDRDLLHFCRNECDEREHGRAVRVVQLRQPQGGARVHCHLHYEGRL
ncbi:hypothetical protein ACFSQ7_36740 [Paenibacillus rhizoplanae]